MTKLTYLVRAPYEGEPTYVSLEDPPRYVVTPHFRPAHRGPNDRVRDGWVLTDTWTEVRLRFDMLAEVEREITNRAMDRDRIRQQPPERFIGWTAATDSRYGIAELRLTMVRPASHTMMLGLVSTRTPEVRAESIAKLLGSVGLLGLPEEVR